MILSAVLFIKRVSETTQIMAVDERTDTEGAHHSLIGKQVPEEVLVFRIFGAFFFGVADKLETALKRARRGPGVLTLRMRKVLAMDATSLNALEDLYEKLRHKNRHLILSGAHTQPFMMMDRAGFLDQLGRENICAVIDAALEPPARSSTFRRLLRQLYRRSHNHAFLEAKSASQTEASLLQPGRQVNPNGVTHLFGLRRMPQRPTANPSPGAAFLGPKRLRSACGTFPDSCISVRFLGFHSLPQGCRLRPKPSSARRNRVHSLFLS